MQWCMWERLNFVLLGWIFKFQRVIYKKKHIICTEKYKVMK